MGDEAATEQDMECLVREHLAPLRGYLASLGATGDLVDDLAQDVFLAALKNMASYDSERSLRGWLFGIARNLIHQEFRKSKRDSRIRSGFTTEVIIAAETAEGDECLKMTREGALLALRSCLGSLPARMRRFFDLRFMEQKSIQLIARVLGMRDGTVRINMLRMRQALRRCIEAQLEERP
jgi:RNA polymerase sigma-70 factor, ECF subfamily